MTKCNRCLKRWISKDIRATADLPACGFFGLSHLQAAPRFQEQVLRVRPLEAITEVSGYFCEAWGNRARIDYGSGMELNFLCWLCVFHFCYSSAPLSDLQNIGYVSKSWESFRRVIMLR